MKKYQVNSVSNTYEYLWSACQKNVVDAKTTDGSPWYYYFTAMTMAYFCYEAFLNHLLHYIAPDVWANEKEYFSKPPYKGTEGKLKKVCEISGIDFPNKGDTQYQQIRLLKELRDFVAHGKTEQYSSIVEANSGHEITEVQSKLFELVTKKNAERAIPLLREFIITTNKKVKEKTYCDHLALHPLQGFSGHASASEI